MRYKGWLIVPNANGTMYELKRTEHAMTEYGYFITIKQAKEFIDILSE